MDYINVDMRFSDEFIAELLSDVKNYLDITWEDRQTDDKLTGILKRGAEFVQRLTPRALDFPVYSAERGLLLDYCRYARAGALDEFTKNYAGALETFRIDEAVRADVENAN